MFKWFLTQQGRLFTRTTVGVITASIFSTHVATHGPFINQLKGVFKMYHNDGTPRELDADVLANAKEVLNACKLTDAQKKRVSFFMTSGFDICHIGGYNSIFGAAIGLPISLDKRDMAVGELKIVGKENFDWITEGMDLMDTLRISQDAKKFSIAKEIYASNIYRVVENGLIASFCFYFPAILAKYHNEYRKAYQWGLPKRFVIYVLLYAIGLTAYCAVKDPVKHLTEMQADKMAAELGPEYHRGGIEYYIRLLERNRELRVVFGDAGERLFTREGNMNYFLFAPKLPISKRLENLQNLKVDYNQKM